MNPIGLGNVEAFSLSDVGCRRQSEASSQDREVCSGLDSEGKWRWVCAFGVHGWNVVRQLPAVAKRDTILSISGQYSCYNLHSS